MAQEFTTEELAAKHVLFTKTFKKYTSEFDAKVVDYVRDWARSAALKAFHEDRSIVKVTGTQAEIVGLLEVLKERFGYIPPEERKEVKK
jgi:hypothetical protein